MLMSGCVKSKSVSTWVGGGNGGGKKLGGGGGEHEINRFADSTKCQLKSMQCNNCLNRSSSVPVLMLSNS